MCLPTCLSVCFSSWLFSLISCFCLLKKRKKKEDCLWSRKLFPWLKGCRAYSLYYTPIESVRYELIKNKTKQNNVLSNCKQKDSGGKWSQLFKNFYKLFFPFHIPNIKKKKKRVRKHVKVLNLVWHKVYPVKIELTTQAC